MTWAPANASPREVEPFKLMWLEEPVPAENIDAIAGSARLHQHPHLLR